MIEDRKIPPPSSILYPRLLIHVAPRVIGAAHERAGLDMAKTHLVCVRLKLLKLVRRDVALDFELAVGRLQVLSDRHDVDITFTQVAERRHDLVLRFTDAEHETLLGEHVAAHLFRFLQDI